MVRLSRVAVVHGALAVFALGLLLRAAQVQLWEGDAWAAKAARQHVTAFTLPAPRGEIRDANGVSLAASRELVRLSIAPAEVADRRALTAALVKLRVPRAWIRRGVDRRRRWVTLPGRYPASEAAPLLAMRGVHGASLVDRRYAPAAGIASLVGRVDANGSGAEGLELALDTLLRGTPGRESDVRDARGRRFDSPQTRTIAPHPGHSVTLTISYELQEIVDRALGNAVARMQAEGGDILVLDPHDGAILAMASRRQGRRTTSATALTEPFEPGSTLKPLIAAALLGLGRARADETIETFHGRYETNGRTIHDLHRAPMLTLADVIRWSSNVGIVRFAERLTTREQYEALRDFGFGAPTLLSYPSEASGTLRQPARWSRQSAASLAMGYEIAVTPLQLALAYASIANGGELLEPMLVREIRAPDGDVVFRARRRVVRRTMDETIAEALRGMLIDVVAKGTAVEADLSTYAVGGKTGTARRVAAGSGYARGQYYATFVGLFPADDPQFVVLTKLDNPVGVYGGSTAAPISKVVLEAALAARDAALDRGALAEHEASFLANGAVGSVEAPALRSHQMKEGLVVPPTVVVDLPAERSQGRRAEPPREIPNVSGLPLRDAARTLHEAGFRVRLTRGRGTTAPVAGTVVPVGTLVHLPSDR